LSTPGFTALSKTSLTSHLTETYDLSAIGALLVGLGLVNAFRSCFRVVSGYFAENAPIFQEIF
jgi:hypothetical protein